MPAAAEAPPPPAAEATTPPAPVRTPVSVPAPVAGSADQPQTIVIRLEVVMKDERGRPHGTQEIDVPVRLERFSPPHPSRTPARAPHREPPAD